jgi:hypothetical protein
MEVTEDTVEGPRTEQRVARQPLSTAMVFMRVDLNFRTDKGLLAYSTDGRRWMPLGGEFPLAFAWRTGTFQGEQFAVSCFNQRQSDGYIDIDSFALSKP